MTDRPTQRLSRCPECPWQLTAEPGKFPTERYVALAETSRQVTGPLFACHMSAEGGEVACAGYLSVCGLISITARLMALRGRLDPSQIEPVEPGVLYESYGALAVANGVPADHPALQDPDIWAHHGPDPERGTHQCPDK